MLELAEAYWPYFLIAFLIGVAVAWWCFVALRRTRVVTTTKDVLDEGADPAARNQALIDAPPVSAPAANLGGSPVAAAAAGPVVASEGDDLTQIKGVGPKLAGLLGDLGVKKFAQIAEWSDADIDRIDSQLGRFEGRIRRDHWVTQAKLLESGDEEGFAAKFGNS